MMFGDSFIHMNTMRSLELSKIQEQASTPTKKHTSGVKPNQRMLILIHSNNSSQRGGLPEDSVEVTLLPPATMETPMRTEYSPYKLK